MDWLVYGTHPVAELLKTRSRDIKQLLLAKERDLSSLVAAAKAHKIPYREVPTAEIDRIGRAQRLNHQGVMAFVGEYPYVDLEQLLTAQNGTPLLLAVDGVTDPQNLGSMVRSALVLGATGLILPRDRTASITPTVVRVSAGATEHLACAQIPNLRRALEQAKEAGLRVVGTAESAGVHPAQANLQGPLAVVLGSEGRGMRPIIAALCDVLITIPSAAGIASLNVAAATAAVFYEISRQRALSLRPSD